MPIQIIPECRFCHTAIEPTEPMGAWTHTGLSIWCPGSGQGETATPIVRVEPLSKLGHPEVSTTNQYGFPIYPKGFPVSEVRERDRGQKLIFHCKEHPDAVWASKDPLVSNWFGDPHKEVCSHGFYLATYVLAEEYSPTRND